MAAFVSYIKQFIYRRCINNVKKMFLWFQMETLHVCELEAFWVTTVAQKHRTCCVWLCVGAKTSDIQSVLGEHCDSSSCEREECFFPKWQIRRLKEVASSVKEMSADSTAEEVEYWWSCESASHQQQQLKPSFTAFKNIYFTHSVSQKSKLQQQ